MADNSRFCPRAISQKREGLGRAPLGVGHVVRQDRERTALPGTRIMPLLALLQLPVAVLAEILSEFLQQIAE